MKKRIAKLTAIGMAFGMALCGGPSLQTKAVGMQAEVPDSSESSGTEAEGWLKGSEYILLDSEYVEEMQEPESGVSEALQPIWDEAGLRSKVQQGGRILEQIAAEREIIATLYRTDFYALSSAAGFVEKGIAEIPSGAQLMIEGVELQDGLLWYLVEYVQEERHYIGYVQADYLISTDSRFLDWQQKWLTGGLQEVGSSPAENKARSDDIQAFPESYRSFLYQLKSRHPNWVFVPMNTGVEWRTVIAEEMKGDRSWVHSSKGAAWKGEQRDRNWYRATQEAVEYCVDPRNFLNDQYLFMFELLTYNGEYHTRQGVQSIIQNSFMRGEIPGEGIAYADHFYRVGQSLGVSPYHLAARVYQEQGVNGTSPLISGTYPGYEGYYNYYNISASGTSDKEVTESGLRYAQSHGWNSRQKSITEGAQFISQNYILKGQDTLYLQKFDVDNSYYGMFYHQYMQNLTAPMTEGAATRAAYERAGALNNRFVFKIPVYKNMPASPCPEPGKSQGINPIPDEEQLLREFIIRLYVNALGRKSYAAEEVDYWYERLKSGKSDGAGVAYGFFFSDEFRNKGLSDEEYVDILYRVMFDRFGDEGGRKNWLDKLELGMSREYVYAGFANSDEFKDICTRYGVKQGRIICNAYRDQNEGVTAFVNRLYHKALGRDGDDDGMENWCRTILRKEKNMESVAYGFIFSSEFLNHNVTNERFVQILYRTFLNREGDPEGFADWVERLNQGMDRETVFRGFARSQEFKKLAEEYGIDQY